MSPIVGKTAWILTRLLTTGLAWMSWCLAAQSFGATYDVSRDFLTSTNPGGAWSYGWKSTLDGAFSLLTYHDAQPDPSGGIWEYWYRIQVATPSVYRNSGTATLFDGGQGVYPPGVVWFGPGSDGQPQNFGVIRFSVPTGEAGTYQIATAVRTRLDGPLAAAADFHLVLNGVELFGQNVVPISAIGYTNVLSLAAGDTLDFMVGRGSDGREYGGGLKIAVTVSRFDVPVMITRQPQSQSVPESAPAAFSVEASGDLPLTFQWYKNGAAIAGGTNPAYVIASAPLTDNGALFKVVAANIVSNIAYTATSSVVSLTVMADTNPPVLISARSIGLESVEVSFSERIAPANANDLAHYALSGTNGNVAILGATLDPTHTNVFLKVNPLIARATYTLTVSDLTDQSSASNVLVSASASFTAFPLTVLITEFVAENTIGLTDEDGEHSDWIELQNQTPIAVDLGGWHLTDDALNLAKWTFPSTVLQPAQFLVVFASGKDRRVSGGQLHTNFRLNADGEYLALVNSGGAVVQDFTFGPQHQDVSFGIVGSTNLFMPVPTPGGSNGPGVLGFVADTKFTPNRGFYSNAFSLSITSATAGAEIWFTVNGNVPAPGATGAARYTNPLTISNTTTIRAAAFLTNFAPTHVDTHTFLFIASAASQASNPAGFPATWYGAAPADYGMDPNIVTNAAAGYDITNSLLSLPAISLVAPVDDLFAAPNGIYYNAEQAGPDSEREASIELIFPDGSPGFQHEAGLRIHGFSSRYHWFTSKHSFHMNFRDRYGPAKLHFPLFADTRVSDFDQIVLRGCSTDSYPAKDINLARYDPRRATYIRDQWVRDAMRDLGHPASHGRYVHLWLNGLYWGLYNIAELLGSGFAAAYFGGSPDDYDVIKDVGEVDGGDAQAWSEFQSLVSAGVTTEALYQRIQGNNPDGTRNAQFPVYIDLPGYVDYMLLHITIGADDWPYNNWWGCRQRGSASDGFHFTAWDQEISNYSLTSTTTVHAQPFEAVNEQVAYFYDRLRGYVNFRQLFMDRVWFALTGNGPLAPGPSATRWLARQSEIDRAIIAETARWGDSGHQPASTRTNWLNEMQWVSNFWASNQVRAIQRFRNVNLWPLLGPPVFSRSSGYFTNSLSLGLTHTNGTGTVWFTLDGHDPRAPNAAPSPTARQYSGFITLTNSTRVRARVTDGTNWSPPADAIYLPLQALTNVVVTEIYYNPPGEATVAGDAFEFIELQNRGPFPLDLSGVHFTAGISFSFTNGATVQPGAFVVLARDATNFATRFAGMPLDGLYTGKLDNSGETLTLADALGGVIFNFAYDDAAPWPASADGFGNSLQRVTFTSSAANAAQWIAAPPTPGFSSPLLDSDGDGLPDLWEIAHGLDPNDPAGDNGANGDPDHDGRTNLAEFLAGTDPTNASSVMKFDSITVGPGVALAFRAAPNKSYTVQFAPSVSIDGWSTLTSIPARSTDRVEIIEDRLLATNRFYRLVIP